MDVPDMTNEIATAVAATVGIAGSAVFAFRKMMSMWNQSGAEIANGAAQKRLFENFHNEIDRLSKINDMLAERVNEQQALILNLQEEVMRLKQIIAAHGLPTPLVQEVDEK